MQAKEHHPNLKAGAGCNMLWRCFATALQNIDGIIRKEVCVCIKITSQNISQEISACLQMGTVNNDPKLTFKVVAKWLNKKIVDRIKKQHKKKTCKQELQG